MRTFAEGRDGALWIGTADGLARLHDGRLTRHTTADGLSSGVVMALLEDRHGVLWVGTNGSGVDRFVDGRFVNVGPADGLAHHDVRALKESRDGTIWIGTLGGGITLWRDGVVSWLTRAEGLSNHNILTLHEDPDGTVWIGTNGGGLNRYHDGRVTHYTTANGLPSDGVFQILDDGRGSLWMSSNRGIFRVTRQDLDDVAEGRRADVRALRFGRPEGLGAAGAMGGSQSAGAVDASGRLWFPTIAGIAIIDPGTIRPNTAPPPVHIVRLTVDRAVVSGAALGAIPRGRARWRSTTRPRASSRPPRCCFAIASPDSATSGWMPVPGEPRTSRTCVRAATGSTCRRPTTTACGTTRARPSTSCCGPASTRRPGSPRASS